MPYYKVHVTVQLAGVRYVEADDPEYAANKAIEQCDNSVPYMHNWDEDGEVDYDLEAVEEVGESEYEENQDDI